MNDREQRKSIEGAYLKLDIKNNNEKYAIHNISCGGLCFCSHQVFEIDDRMSVTIYLTRNKTHHVKARICYFESNNKTSDGDYYGLSFLDNYLKMN